MRGPRRRLLLVVLTCAWLAACSTPGEPLADRVPSKQRVPMELAAPEPEGAAPADRLLVKTARLSLEVDDVDRAAAAVRAEAARAGGLVSATDLQRRNGHLWGSITVRIPAARLDAFLEAVSKLGTVESSQSSAEDVTKAVADLETRLRVKRGTEERLRGLLAGRTGSLADVLAVERELDRVVGEIEALLAERKDMAERVALSSVAVELHAPRPITEGNGLVPAVRQSLRSLRASFVAVVAILVFVLPWLAIAAVVYGLVRLARARWGAR